MSRMKCFYDQAIATLAKITGYTERYIEDAWYEWCEDGNPNFESFIGVVLERDL